ncbi:cytochrome p450 domain-containing protein [Phthorimaea operculella]|nr:cytochrome p450 domain-containing protein [Phthorimaea operculella]
MTDRLCVMDGSCQINVNHMLGVLYWTLNRSCCDSKIYFIQINYLNPFICVIVEKMLWLIWTIGLLAALVLYLRTVYSKFDKHGVKTDPGLPLLGAMGRIILGLDHLADSVNRTYFKFPNERFVGRFEFTKPVLLVRDLELIKRITIKDFEHFLDHRVQANEHADHLFARNLFSLKGQEWKDMRSTLSPAFTSSKIRLMVPFMVDVGDKMILNIKKTLEENGTSHLDIEVKDLLTRYTCDVIASCIFGLKVDSHTDRNNEFYVQGRKSSSFNFKQLIMFFVAATMPRLMNVLKLKFFEAKTNNFFRSLVTSTMKEREKHNIVRPDMIHLLMEAKKGKLVYDESIEDGDTGFATAEESALGKKKVIKAWSEDDLIAQAVIFFVAGFESVAGAVAFLLFELALNPEVQDKLAKEIKETDAQNGGKFDFNTIQEMKYMDMVMCELLRKYPPAVVLDRMCTKDYNLGKPNDEATSDFILRKGDGLQIPYWSIHWDPQYFPNPEKFDPERFSEENKHNIKPFTYAPFGLGPRNCIGSRFALCEVKVLAYQLLRHMEVSPCPRTTIPIQLATGTFNILMRGGHWLRFKVRA